LRNETQRLEASLVCRVSSLDPAYLIKINGLVFRQPLVPSFDRYCKFIGLVVTLGISSQEVPP